MQKKLAIGINDFKKLREENYYYVDKSLLIKEIIDEDAEVLLLPRPRRFGKSLNLSMLRYFFENSENDNSNLFSGLKIAENEFNCLEKMGKFPVINLDFKGSRANNWELALQRLKRSIAVEFQRHSYLLKSDKLLEYEKEEYQDIMALKADQTAYEFALENLSRYLKEFHQQNVIILIDEYDEAVQASYLNEYYDQMLDFMRSFLIRGLKGNPNLEKGILTGILRVAKESIFSGLNNLLVSGLLESKYDQFFGLLEKEVEEIFSYYDLEYRLQEVKRWYNGYYFGDQLVYNPWSIINCIASQGELKPYWVNTSGNELIKDLIINAEAEVKGQFEDLLKNKSFKTRIDENIVFADVRTKSSSLWSFLLYSGYLKANTRQREQGRLYCELEIPNQEIKYIYEEIIYDWLEESISSNKLSEMLTALITGNIEEFSLIFKDFVLSSMSSFDPAGNEAEKVYHAFVLGLLLNLNDNYEINSNRESGYGRYDIMVIPNKKDKLGIIIEFKKVADNENLDKAVKAALKQIEERKYQQELEKRGIKNVIHLGIAFSGKNVKIKAAE
ncbi:AAA family ATPase [Halanaerobium saccharolyticum]|jgi:ribosomal protein S21|uniref:PD-(D/E)XK nuclease superfamily protein n=1 Tax=Halanaerobium saccharolyticum TaxID=43595 RepID=A0A2T5RTI4_9FIRM|nr:AAA family ATPase [Halanaerobium saccharolyticum]PTW03565.1 PD-(D/E)XK nuclease superfamily protein [Halanaerobium saccharolyticum]